MTVPAVAGLKVPPHPAGSPARDGTDLGAGRKWPRLHEKALYGLAGKVVRTIAPETEADPAALLATFLVAFGSSVGPGPRARADGADHPVRLNGVIVGNTSKARKGTSLNRILELMEVADHGWWEHCVTTGLSSGEGLIRAASQGEDRRRFVHEGEFAKTLKVASREGNVLSEVLRLAWDSGHLQVMTKEPLEVHGAHISVLGHITEEELRTSLTGLHAANGFGNRFLWVCARRTNLLPDGGNLGDEEIASLGSEVGGVLDEARRRGILKRSSAASAPWSELYQTMASDEPGGLLGGLTARAEGQVLRLSVSYALLDKSSRIEVDHLEAAWALWSYCRESAAYLFGGQMGDPELDELLSLFREERGRQFSLTELGRALGSHVYGDKLAARLQRLLDLELIASVVVATGGRPSTKYMSAEC